VFYFFFFHFVEIRKISLKGYVNVSAAFQNRVG
jgi:hypothetical protein